MRLFAYEPEEKISLMGKKIFSRIYEPPLLRGSVSMMSIKDGDGLFACMAGTGREEEGMMGES
jgi:hypothetical protein